MQRDPNQTALILSSALSRNAQSQQAFLSMAGGGQYIDGMTLYQYVGSNPVTRLDPRGLALLLSESFAAKIRGTVATIGIAAVSAFERWALRMIGRMVSYTYTSAVTAWTIGEAANTVDVAALSAVGSDIANWMANNPDKYQGPLKDGFQKASESYSKTGGPDPNDPWWDFFRRIPESIKRVVENSKIVRKGNK